METINNKKGNEGFMISGWTAWIAADGRATKPLSDVLTPRDNGSPEISLMVHWVRVMSCGKKQMTLLSLDGAEEMKGNFYAPETRIYKKRGDAMAEAERMLAECKANILGAAPEYLEQQYGTAPSYLNAEGRANFAARKETARRNLELIQAGGLNSRVFLYSDSDKFG